MDTIRAIASMARAEAAGLDGYRSPGAGTLNKSTPQMHIAANKAIIIAMANGLGPDRDEATQWRLASAVERQAVAPNHPIEPTAVARSILQDVMVQEVAREILVATGQKDPLSHLAHQTSNRERLNPEAILARQGLKPIKALSGASQGDLRAIAAGQYDRLTSDHTRFAVSSILSLTDQQMKVTSRDPEAYERTAHLKSYKEFPAMGLGNGPTKHSAPIFGRKGLER